MSVERGRRWKAHDACAPTSMDRDVSSSAQGRGRGRKATLRRGATVALLGVGFFVSVGPSSRPDALALVDSTAQPRIVAHTPSITYIPPPVRHPIMLYMPDMELWTAPRRGRKGPALPFSVVIGRISAWFCTVLYMTSRLPQIWTNFQRRSVRGLSMLLFLLAFFANLLYSISILSNPKAVGPDRYEYLSESLPFLLGSSGTLIFDLVILVQYAMWHDKHTEAPPSP